MIDFYYDTKNNILKNKLNITNQNKLKEAENYYYAIGLKKLQKSKYFRAEPDFIKDVHNILFNKVYDWAGQYRLVDIERYEPALNGLSVQYCPYKDIEKKVENVFQNIERVKLNDLNHCEKIDYIVDIVARLWQIHSFRDCNTRTMIAFINQYCASASLSCEINLLKDNIEYFRRSLVAATFEDAELEVKANKSYVLRIMNEAFKGNYKK